MASERSEISTFSRNCLRPRTVPGGYAKIVNNYENRYLVNFIALRQRVEYGVHGVQHRHHFHRRDPAANFGKRHNVREQYRHAVEHLEKNDLSVNRLNIDYGTAAITWQVSMGFSPDLSRSATCLGII